MAAAADHTVARQRPQALTGRYRSVLERLAFHLAVVLNSEPKQKLRPPSDEMTRITRPN